MNFPSSAYGAKRFTDDHHIQGRNNGFLAFLVFFLIFSSFANGFGLPSRGF